VQYHPFKGLPGAIQRELSEQWGQHQVQASVAGEKRLAFLGKPGVARLAALNERRFGGGVSESLSRWQFEASYVLDRAEHFGFVVRHHRGYDYYNINFQDTRSFWALGLMWDLGRLDKLMSRSPD
jgi:hypothetical protein